MDKILVASTLTISNRDFLELNIVFVESQGRLTKAVQKKLIPSIANLSASKIYVVNPEDLKFNLS